MPIPGFNNPFQLPPQPVGYGEKKPGRNPFQPDPSGGQPSGDSFNIFQQQINQGRIVPNLDQPRPADGLGNRFLAIG